VSPEACRSDVGEIENCRKYQPQIVSIGETPSGYFNTSLGTTESEKHFGQSRPTFTRLVNSCAHFLQAKKYGGPGTKPDLMQKASQ